VLSGTSGDPLPAAQSSPGATGPISGTSNPQNDSKITIPFGFNGKKIPLSEVKSSGTFKAMNPNMQDRMLRMFREHPSIGIGEGFRDSKTQEKLFLSRYRRTDKDTGIKWQGSNWEHVSGAAAAPPGKSMHELGLAADLVGDLDWLQTNAARFGLKTFAGVNKEPWHVQPLELPNSRSDYEKGGASWGDGGAASADPETSFSAGKSTAPIYSGSSNAAASIFGSGGMAHDYTGTSIQDVLNSVLAQRPHGNGAMGLTRSASAAGGSNSSGVAGGTPASLTTLGSGGGAMSMEQIAQLAFDAGFRGDDISKAVAIAWRESHGNPSAHNPNRATGDDSYGLWQINMLPKALGPAMTALGYTGNDLLNPSNAAKAAYSIYQRSGFGPWTTYRSGIGFGDKGAQGLAEEYAQAKDVVTSSGLGGRGDPAGESSYAMPQRAAARQPITTNGSSTVHISSNPRIDMPLSFTFNGVPGDVDIKQIASKVRGILKNELDIELMRSA
jgi:hypothetical protein